MQRILKALGILSVVGTGLILSQPKITVEEETKIAEDCLAGKTSSCWKLVHAHPLETLSICKEYPKACALALLGGDLIQYLKDKGESIKENREKAWDELYQHDMEFAEESSRVAYPSAAYRFPDNDEREQPRKSFR